MRDVLIITSILACAFWAMQRPVVGIYSFVGFSILNPHSYAWSWAQSFPFALILAISVVTGMVFSREKLNFPKQREVTLLLSLWVIFGLSTVDAVLPDRGIPSSVALDKFIYVSKIFFMVFLSMILVNTTEKLKWLMRVIAVSIGLYAAKSGLFSLATGFSHMVWGPERSFLYANNAIGLAMGMNIPILFYLIKLEKSVWFRQALWAMLFLSYPAILATFSRGAWLGLGLATILLFPSTKAKIWVVAGSILALLIISPILSSDWVPERVASRFDQLVNYEEEASAQSRFWSWKTCTLVGVSNPFLGEGFNFYSPEVYRKYYPEFRDHYGENKVWSCHNAWLTILAEHGIIAFLVWVCLVISTILSSRKFRKTAGENLQGWYFHQYGQMFRGSLLVYCLVGVFYDAAYFDLFYQIIGALVIAKSCAKLEWSSADLDMMEQRKREGLKMPLKV